MAFLILRIVSLSSRFWDASTCGSDRSCHIWSRSLTPTQCWRGVLCFQWTRSLSLSTKSTISQVPQTARSTAAAWPTASRRTSCRRPSSPSEPSKRSECSRTRATHSLGECYMFLHNSNAQFLISTVCFCLCRNTYVISIVVCTESFVKTELFSTSQLENILFLMFMQTRCFPPRRNCTNSSYSLTSWPTWNIGNSQDTVLYWRDFLNNIWFCSSFLLLKRS